MLSEVITDEKTVPEVSRTLRACKMLLLAHGLHLKNGRRGMIVEMKPLQVQVQWGSGYGTEAVEWNRLDELHPE